MGHGFLSVVLVLCLVAIGIGALGVGVLLTRTLVGDPTISLWLTTHPTGSAADTCSSPVSG